LSKETNISQYKLISTTNMKAYIMTILSFTTTLLMLLSLSQINQVKAACGYDAPVVGNASMFIDISTSPTGFLGSAGTFDDSETLVNLGFNARIGCGQFSSLYVSSNGVVSATPTGAAFSNQATAFPNMIAVFWDDWFVTGGTDTYVRWSTVGTAPNRIFVVTWYVHNFAGNVNARALFQAQVHESLSTSDIYFVYVDTTSSNGNGCGSRTVQLGSISGSTANDVWCFDANGTPNSITDDFSLHFTNSRCRDCFCQQENSGRCYARMRDSGCPAGTLANYFDCAAEAQAHDACPCNVASKPCKHQATDNNQCFALTSTGVCPRGTALCSTKTQVETQESSDNNSNSNNSTPFIAGVAAGSVGAVALVALVALVVLKRRARVHQQQQQQQQQVQQQVELTTSA